ncbi:MAG: hypothetical protein ACTSYD_11830 [Candidatus Heimdallarchaeaceae archaeon]
MVEALKREPVWGVVEREVKKTEEYPEEGNRRDKSKDHRIEERIRVKRDEDRTMVQEERTEDLSHNDMEGPKTRGREELEEKEQGSKSEEEVRKSERNPMNYV